MNIQMSSCDDGLKPSTFNDEPGTLVWVGDRLHPEFVEAFRYCHRHAAQIAIRRTPSDLVKRPAGFVKRILFTRTDRQPIPEVEAKAIQTTYGGVPLLALGSSLTDGEARTGERWSGVQHIRFSQWRDVLPIWLEACGHQPASANVASRSVMIVCDRYETAEPYLDWAASLGQTAIWKREPNRCDARNVGTVVWDDSVASPASKVRWRARLRRVSGSKETLRHVWLVTQPNADEIRLAISGGVAQVYSKPINLFSVLGTVPSTMPCNHPS